MGLTEKNKQINKGKIIEYAIVILFLLFVVAAEIHRLVRWDFTWDESLTYIHFVKPIFIDQNASFSEFIAFFKERSTYWCAMNNHLLNTLSMGVSAKLLFPIFGYGNEVVLRLPVFCCFCIYIAATAYMYLKNRITWIGVFLLCSSRYMMDFFTLSRGYAMAATFVLLACVCIIEWEQQKEKEWLILLGVFFVSIGTIAQTITLLIALPIYIWLFIRILQNKILLHFFKPLRLIIIMLLVALNGATALFHLTVSNADHCLSPSDDKSIRSVLMNMFIGGEEKTLYYLITIFFYILMIGAWILFFKKKTQWNQMSFLFIITIYLIPMAVIVNTIRLGLPIARMLLPAYPVMILALHSSICQISDNINVKIKPIPAILCLLIVIAVGYSQRDLTLSKEWPCCQGIKSQCYEALDNKTTVVPPVNDSERSESWTFYKDQIYTHTGYEIFK